MAVTPFKSEFIHVYLCGLTLGIPLSNEGCAEARDARWCLLSCSLRSWLFAGKTFAVFTSLSVARILDNTEVLRLVRISSLKPINLVCLNKCSFAGDLSVSGSLGIRAQSQAWRRPFIPCSSSRSRCCVRTPSLTSSLRQPLRRCPPALPSPWQTRCPLVKPKNPSVLAQAGRAKMKA
jgi:hypothetical protein